MKRLSFIYKILKFLGIIKEIEIDQKEAKVEMCNRAIKSGVCPGTCHICAWNH